MNVIERLIALIAPHECIRCTAEGSLLCTDCQMLLPPVVPCCYRCGRVDKGARVCRSCQSNTALHSLCAVTPYDDTAKALVQGVKYERQRAGALTIAHMIARRVQSDVLPSGVVVTHAPTVQGRVRARGYDQAELIAQEVARLCNLPYRSLLMRLGTQRQVGQSRSVRQQQMKQAFLARQQVVVPKQPVLLIDDVITTGSTLEAAAHALHQAGAGRISAAVFARA